MTLRFTNSIIKSLEPDIRMLDDSPTVWIVPANWERLFIAGASGSGVSAEEAAAKFQDSTPGEILHAIKSGVQSAFSAGAEPEATTAEDGYKSREDAA